MTAKRQLVFTALLLTLLGCASLASALNEEEVDTQCASTADLDDVTAELEGLKSRLVNTQEELDSWQNTTVSIIKQYLLDTQGDGNVCNIEDSPSLQQIRDETRDTNNDLRAMKDDLRDTIYDVQDIKDGLRDTNDDVRVIKNDLRDTYNDVRDIKNTQQNNSHNVQDVKDGLRDTNEDIREIKDELQQISRAQDEQHQQLTMQVMTVLRQLSTQLQHIANTTSTEMEDGDLQSQSPVYSCQYLPQGSPTGYYWIQKAHTNEATLQYCDMTRRCCDSTEGWMRVAHIDMTDPTQYCPPGFRLITSPKRACGRPGPPGWVSTTFPVHGVQYSRVCGRVIAYQDKTPDAFGPYYHNRQFTIDGWYVNGVSLTHGQDPRKHIWTFAAALDEVRSDRYTCPCTKTDSAYIGVVPPFIGQDYFCDTGSRNNFQLIFYPTDPLWDGAGCGGSSTCCTFNNPPWFCKQLPQPTTDDIELRLCANEHISNEDTPIEIVELYVQ